MRRLLRSAVMKARRSISVSQSSCEMFTGFSFGATVRVFGGAFVGAFAAFTDAFLFDESTMDVRIGYSSSRDVHCTASARFHAKLYKHGERGVIMEEDEEGDDFMKAILLISVILSWRMAKVKGKVKGKVKKRHDDPVDDLGRTIADARSRRETEKERENLDRMLEDHRKALHSDAMMV
ncbi:hypothetical protein QYE76_065277 [Lolium multiflorum]|uniref:Transmembrane protein n=1 Tax=Lolium multiflorum TaxID=4521 RepID=A0AAD8SAR0_LOLMU|nr:hypothetical protein QYE76_065277 [Lolium multiflorum]